jgi:hypothetical protein
MDCSRATGFKFKRFLIEIIVTLPSKQIVKIDFIAHIFHRNEKRFKAIQFQSHDKLYEN